MFIYRLVQWAVFCFKNF